MDCPLQAVLKLCMMRQTSAEPLALRMVFVTARAIALPSPLAVIDACEPPLKAKNPKNRMNPPKADN